ncbi:hypothetical protein Patl1_37035 [Pistacia atlantica]|nr:hypothetical protein Patl1_37035 [Pistacia atlantica]
MCRDLGYYWLRLVVYVTLAIGLATVFKNLGTSYSSTQARGSLLMFVASFLTFMTIGGFPSFVEEIKVFERERLNGHNSVTAFVVGNTFSALPYLSLMMTVASLVPNFLMGIITGAGILALMILGQKFPNNLTGEQILRERWQLETGYSKWVDLAILFGMVILYRLLFLTIIKKIEGIKPIFKALMSTPLKQTSQIVENPNATALQ